MVMKYLSKTPDVQNGYSGTRFEYADGSVGFKPDNSKWLYVTSPDNTKTTYDHSTWIKAKVEKPNGDIEFYNFEDKDNRLLASVDKSGMTVYGEDSGGYRALHKFVGDSIRDLAAQIDSLTFYDVKYDHCAIRIGNVTHWPELQKISYNGPNFDYTGYAPGWKEIKYKGGRVELYKNDKLVYSEWFVDNKYKHSKLYYPDSTQVRFEQTHDKITEYDRQGNVIREIADKRLGEISTTLRHQHFYSGSGRIEEVRGANGKQTFYDNEQSSLKSECYDCGRSGAEYDEQGNKTSMRFKGVQIKLEDGKPSDKLVTVKEDGVEVQYLLNDKCEVVMYKKCNKLYYANGTELFNIIADKILFCQTQAWIGGMPDAKTKISLDEKGGHIYIHYDHQKHPNHHGWCSLNIDIASDGNYNFTHYKRDYTSSYNPSWYEESLDTEYKDGVLIKRYNNCIVKIENSSGVVWELSSHRYGTDGHMPDLRIRTYDGSKITGELNGNRYIEDVRTHDVVEYDENGGRIESHAKKGSIRREYSPQNDLLFESADGKKTWYEKGPDGKMRPTKYLDNHFPPYGYTQIEYIYEGAYLTEKRMSLSGRLTQREFFDKGKKTKIFECCANNPEKVSKVTYLDPKTEKITRIVTFKGQEDSIPFEEIYDEFGNIVQKGWDNNNCIKMKYYENSNQREESVRIKNGKVCYITKYSREGNVIQAGSDDNNCTKKKYYKNTNQVERLITVENGQTRSVVRYNRRGQVAVIFKKDGNGNCTKKYYYGNTNRVKLQCNIVDGQITSLVHFDEQGKDNTRQYLAMQKVAQDRAAKSKKENRTLRKLNPLQKYWLMRKALKQVS